MDTPYVRKIDSWWNLSSAKSWVGTATAKKQEKHSHLLTAKKAFRPFASLTFSSWGLEMGIRSCFPDEALNNALLQASTART